MNPSKFSNFVELLQKRSLDHPDRDCVIFLNDGEDSSEKISYSEIDNSACNVAANLQKRKKSLFTNTTEELLSLLGI